ALAARVAVVALRDGGERLSRPDDVHVARSVGPHGGGGERRDERSERERRPHGSASSGTGAGGTGVGSWAPSRSISMTCVSPSRTQTSWLTSGNDGLRNLSQCRPAGSATRRAEGVVRTCWPSMRTSAHGSTTKRR